MVLLIAFLLWLVPAFVGATTYYVATTGSNSNSGTDIDTPFLTIDKCSRLLVAGDTCYVRGGTYTESGGVRILASGTASSPITLSAYPGETPVIDFPAQVSSNRILIEHANSTTAPTAMGYITVEGFEIKNGWEGVKFTNMHNSIIRRNKIHDGQASGILGVGGHHNVIEKNIIYHQGNWVGCANGTQTCNQQHGLYMHGDSYVVRNNIIYDNIGVGIQQNGSSSSTYTTTRHPSTEFSGSNNWIIADNTVAYQANASGINTWSTLTNNTRIENNILYENRVNGTSAQGVFFTGNGMSGVSIKNNHVYASGSGGTAFIGALSTDPVTEGVQYTQSGNVVNVSAPAFVNGGSNALPASPDFRLTALSPVNIPLANEFPNNGVVGAFQPYGSIVCSITTNVMTCVYDTDTAVPINIPSTAGWSITCTANPTACPGSPTISSVTRHTGTDSQVDITISGIASNACAAGQDWKVSYNSSTGSATGNDNIGPYPGLHQKLFSSTNILATNACTGSGPPSVPGTPHFRYKFDEGTGTNANDESANNLDCTLINSATWVAGKTGTAMGVAQGTQQACTVNWGSGVNPSTQPITAVVPIYIEAGTENSTHYIGGPDLGTNQRAYVCGYLGSWRISLQTTACQSTSSSNLTVAAGWNFLVLEFDSGTDVATLSKDGVTGTGGATAAYTSFTFASNWKFGRLHTNAATGTYRFDEIAVYLSLEDPATLYAAFQQGAPASTDTFSQTAVQFEEVYTSGVSGTVRVLPSPNNTKKVIKGGAVAVVAQVECNNCAQTSFRLTARDNGAGAWLQVPDTETSVNVLMWGSSVPQFLNHGTLSTRVLENGCTVVTGSTQATSAQIPSLTLPASGCTMLRYIIKVRAGASGYTEFRLEKEGGVAFTGSYVLGRIDITDMQAGGMGF